MKKRAIGAVAVVLTGAWALAWSVPASAQEFLKGDRKITEGPGYQAGDFEIHPGLAAEVVRVVSDLSRNPGVHLEVARLISGPLGDFPVLEPLLRASR